MNPGSRAAALIQATHPIPAASVTALTAVLAVARGAGAGPLLWITGSMALGQAAVGWSNDYLDRLEDAEANRTDKPVAAGGIPAPTVGLAAVAALPAAVAASLPLGPAPTAVLAAAVASALLYNLGLKRTVLSWLPYAVSFGLLPVFVWLATGGVPPVWVVAAGSLLGLAGHLTNVLPDLERDVAAGRRGLPHRLGPAGSLLSACGVLLVALAVVVVGGGAWGEPAAVGAGVVALAMVLAVAAAVLRGRPRAGFHLTIAAAAAIVSVLVLSPSVHSA